MPQFPYSFIAVSERIINENELMIKINSNIYVILNLAKDDSKVPIIMANKKITAK